MNAVKFASIAASAIFGFYTLFAIVQMWFLVVGWETFIKISVTALVAIVAIVGIALVYREYIDEKELKKNKYID